MSAGAMVSALVLAVVALAGRHPAAAQVVDLKGAPCGITRTFANYQVRGSMLRADHSRDHCVCACARVDCGGEEATGVVVGCRAVSVWKGGNGTPPAHSALLPCAAAAAAAADVAWQKPATGYCSPISASLAPLLRLCVLHHCVPQARMMSKQDEGAVSDATYLPSTIPYVSADVSITTDTIDVVVRGGGVWGKRQGTARRRFWRGGGTGLCPGAWVSHCGSAVVVPRNLVHACRCTTA
jgi:hypothetical protein